MNLWMKHRLFSQCTLEATKSNRSGAKYNRYVEVSRGTPVGQVSPHERGGHNFCLLCYKKRRSSVLESSIGKVM